MVEERPKFPKDLFVRWSSHPDSLLKQRKAFFWICLIPSAIVAACLVFVLSGLSGWKALVMHPTALFWVIAGTASLTLGLAVCLAVLFLLAQSGIARKTEDEDKLPFPKPMLVLFSFFWIVPVVLTFLQGHFGISLFSPQIVFVLNALCLAPIAVLLLWVRFYSDDKGKGELRTSRRPILFALGMFFLGLSLLSLVGDVQRWLGSLGLPSGALSELSLRVILLAALLPISMICFACWTLFRRALPTDGLAARADASQPDGNLGKKSLWQRFLDIFRRNPSVADDGEGEQEDVPPTWLTQLCKNLPDGVRMNTAVKGKPDRLPAPDAPASDDAAPGESDNLWLLMRLSDDCRPTELQFEFFKRFRDAWEEARLAAEKGNAMSPDMILLGDEGTGRTELLLATALYAAMARRQRVLYLVPDSHLAEILSKRLEKRCSDLFLEVFLSCGVLSAEKARKWIDSLRAKYSQDDEKSSGVDESGSSDILPPNILFATPRDVEHVLFEGHGLFLRGEDISPLRELLRLFEVVLVDDFMELDSMSRAHLPFLLHKMRLLLVSCDIRPQFVVALPRLNEDGGDTLLASRLYGSANFNERNAVTLLPRRCQPAWSVPLVVADAKNAASVCEEIVRLCVEMSPGISIVLYQKGLPLHKCRELSSKLSSGESRVRVISRLDEIGADADADAVLYQTVLAGRSGMALRLTVGNEKTVYLSVASESEALMSDEHVFPAIPDETAVALRIRHLRSLLRFVVPGQPVDLSAWERFGISLSDRHVRKADKAAESSMLETWRQDEWNEPAYGSPLWSYIVLEKSESVKSNAGSEVDFGSLPYTDEDIVQIGDEPLLGLGHPYVRTEDEGVVSVGTGIGSVAQWTEKGRPQGFVDLAHAERLLLGRSEHGESLASASDGAVALFTVDTFHEGNESCRFQMEIMPWNGNGLDYDTPVRALAWTIEPVSEPEAPRMAPGRTFGFFTLPSCRDIHRTVNGTIFALVNKYGQQTSGFNPQEYSYPAYMSGILLAPRRMDSRDVAAMIQRGVFGEWNTESGHFSFVLTHLLSGVMRRLIPDFSFYAALPVFHVRDNATAVSAAVAWLIQPINSGRTVDGLVKELLTTADGQARVLSALREAFGLLDGQRDYKARLRWLRSFSFSAFYFDESRRSDDEQERDFEDDVRLSRETIESIERRFHGEMSEIAGIDDPVPTIECDCSWMLARKLFDASLFADAGTWQKTESIPASPSAGADGRLFSWKYSNREFQLTVGFPEEGGCERYSAFVNVHFHARSCEDSYLEYGVNDPYWSFIGELYIKLRGLFDNAFPSGEATDFAEFLLSFVQGAVAYVKDPLNAATDWPRYPSETVLLGGGDCEDSSILYAELLRRAKIQSAILSIPHHAAVGVDVPMEWTSNRSKPIKYNWLGRTYVYAETANDQFVTPLGEETRLIPSAEAIKADVIPTPLDASGTDLGVRILNAVWRSGRLTVTVCADDAASGVAIAVFGRAKRFVYDEPDADAYPCIGGAVLPPLKPCEVWESVIHLSNFGIEAEHYWIDVFACDVQSGAVVGHFVGVTRLSVK